MPVAENMQRVMISIEKEHLKEIDKRCEELGMSRSTYITSILKDFDLSIVKKEK